MSNLMTVLNLASLVLPALVLGSYAVLRLARHEDFYFAYAPALGRWSSPGRCNRR